MKLKEVNKIIEVLKTSPIRKYLREENKIFLFEDEKLILGDIDKIIKSNQENFESPLKVAVLGEVKAGKSTLVNSLIGKKVSYTNVVEATAAITEIKYCSEEEIIIEQLGKEDIKINSLEDLDIFLNKNRDNQEFFKNVNKISVSTNTDRLKEVTLVDTPGLNTVTNENAERTDNYIVKSDVILWILNSHHLGQSDISEKIETVLDYGKPIICIINRIDEIDGDADELIAYVEDEMGYMFTEIFATSAKNAWDGYYENNKSKIEESNINKLYEYMLENIEKNADEVQTNSIIESMKVQFKRDLNLHKEIITRLNGMIESFKKDIDDLNKFNNGLKQTITNKLEEWIDTEFLEKEKRELFSIDNDKMFNNLARKYSDAEYISKIIDKGYKNLGEYIEEKWKDNIEEIKKREDLYVNDLNLSINKYSVINSHKSNEIIDSIDTVKGGIAGGAIGLGLAGYSAWLGPAAAYISIGHAVSFVFPPLLIVGLIGGTFLKKNNSNKTKANIFNQTETLIFNIKSSVKEKAMDQIRQKLFLISDGYFEQSTNMLMSILEQCNTSYDEVINIKENVQMYSNKIIKLLSSESDI